MLNHAMITPGTPELLVQHTRKLLQLLETLSDDRKLLLGFSVPEPLKADRELTALRQALGGGMLPSAYAEKSLGWLREEGFLSAEAWPVLLHALDRLPRRPYPMGWARRPYRAASPELYADQMVALLHDFVADALLDCPLGELLTGQAPQPVEDYVNSNPRRSACSLPVRIAAALDAGDPAVEKAVLGILQGEARPFFLRAVIQGVLWSCRGELHQALGRLLTTAGLQEGLRQVICENADRGTPEAFLHMLDVILENDLIRFSAVKRAVGTWLGLLAEETSSLERISQKSVMLAARCLREEACIEECLAGEDGMQLYIGLWAIAVRDVHSAVQRAQQLALEGTRQQRLAAGVFAAGIDAPALEGELARQVLTRFPHEPDTAAVYLPMVMRDCLVQLRRRRNAGRSADWRLYFRTEQEARDFDTVLTGLHSRAAKKQVFDPCVFPWHRAVLERSMTAERLCALACLLEDDALIDASIPFFADCDPGLRHYLLEGGYSRMGTPKQRQLVLASVCDKAEQTRGTAIRLVDGMERTAADLAQLETLLRFKYADSRRAILRWLMAQPQEALLGSISRLLGDRKSVERRMAALDLIGQLAQKQPGPALQEHFRQLLAALPNPTAKEKPLVESLLAALSPAEAPEEPLFTEADRYVPVIPTSPLIGEAAAVYMHYFPDSVLAEQLGLPIPADAAGGAAAARQARQDLDSLLACWQQHREDPVEPQADDGLLLCHLATLARGPGQRILFHECWEAWYASLPGTPERLMGLFMLAFSDESCTGDDLIASVVGRGYGENGIPLRDRNRIWQIVMDLVTHHVPKAHLHAMASALLLWLALCVEDGSLWVRFGGHTAPWSANQFIAAHPRLSVLLGQLDHNDGAMLPLLFPAAVSLLERARAAVRRYVPYSEPEGLRLQVDERTKQEAFYALLVRQMRKNIGLEASVALRAGRRGLLSRRALYAWLLENDLAAEALSHITTLSGLVRTAGQSYTARSAHLYLLEQKRLKECLQTYLGKPAPEGEEDLALLRWLDETGAPLVRRVVDGELQRGDTAGPYSRLAGGICRLFGAVDFTAILSALGKDSLNAASGRGGRTGSLCALLEVCVPAPEDTPEQLKKLMEQHGIGRKRIIEAALFNPEWVGLVGGAIGVPAFPSAAYYFIAHMNETLDDVRAARIARYTPLSPEELKNGAFDAVWFRSAYHAVGAETFDLIYDAARYITTGARHARARKYADAALGRLEPARVQQEIAEKRNKDLLMAYALIPLSGEEDLQQRYLYLQQFLKESSGFGGQRAAGERLACGIAMTNLALNAGDPDSTRLQLRMETRLAQAYSGLFVPCQVEEISLRLRVDENGTPGILCEKGGKPLKSIPAKYRKNETVQRFVQVHKQLLEQQRRARRMLEEAMEASTVFTAGELATLMENPALAPMLGRLVFLQGDRFGFLRGLSLADASDTCLPLRPQDELIVAHPFHLRQAGQWLPFQQKLYAEKLVQPFRQVFRELYIKTRDELGRSASLRYAGHQLVPARTLGCLRSRRWAADGEMGLQKICYKENIVVTLWAMADWFSPSEIEAPTLEQVAFSHRQTGEPVSIDDVPDVLFSEVMRDVDLAVSVAHAGGADPEASHSTVEMRAALLRFTLPLLRLKNVELQQRHAVITGKLGRYTVHLGSGVVHRLGGGMIPVLPVHSQHRGRLFLPFADEDPQTAEILSKVLLFAEDDKIRDPAILEQLR